MKNLDAQAAGVGVAVVGTLLVSAWKAASLRGDHAREWPNRVDVMKATLSERANEELLGLQRDIARMIGSLDEGFDPSRVIADPGRMSDRVARLNRLLGTRKHVDGWLNTLLTIAPLFLLALLLALAGSGALFSYLIGFISHKLTATIGGVVLAAAGVSLIVLFLIHAYLQLRLSGAEVLGSPGPR